jgi:hypothetical protein
VGGAGIAVTVVGVALLHATNKTNIITKAMCLVMENLLIILHHGWIESTFK